MNKKTCLSIVCALAINASATDIGTIQVESSTIDDRFNEKKSEISNTSIISGEVVEEKHTENIQQVLQSIPGVTTEVTTGDSLKIHLRGVENQRYMGEKPGVAIVVDGVPVFERTGSVNIDLDNIESIKVIKGGASYLFGDDALSGAVIITTKKGAKYNNSFGAVEFGSYGYRKLLARQGFANDYLSAHIQVSERQSDGYHDKSGYEAKYLNGKIQYYIDNSSDVTFGLEYSKRKKDSHGTVGGATEAAINPKSIYTGNQESRDYTRHYDVELLKTFLTYSKDFNYGANLLVNGYYYTDETEFMSSPQTRDANYVLDPTLGDDDYVYKNHYEQVQSGVKSEYRDSFKNSAALLGLDLRKNEYKNKTTYATKQSVTAWTGWPIFGLAPTGAYYNIDDEKSNDVTDEDVYALYGEYKYALTNDLSITGNLRYDYIKLDYKNSDNTKLNKKFDVYSYRVGMNYQLSDASTLFMNYSTGFRAPTIKQLFAGDTSAWGDTQSNPDLKPEKSENYEIGIRAKRAGLKYEAAIFQIDRKDFIMKTSGSYGASTGTFTDMYKNIGGAKNQGLELSLDGDITKDLSFNTAYTYLRAKFSNYHNLAIDLDGNSATEILSFYDVTGNTIPRTSRHNVNFILDYKITKELSLSSELNVKSSYYADDLNKIKIAGHETVNLIAAYKRKIGLFDTNFFVRVTNLFDKQYYSSARSSSDRDDNGIIDAEDLSISVNQGRVYTAGLSLKF